VPAPYLRRVLSPANRGSSPPHIFSTPTFLPSGSRHRFKTFSADAGCGAGLPQLSRNFITAAYNTLIRRRAVLRR